jgi:putative ABC transport system ATP-binding protein
MTEPVIEAVDVVQSFGHGAGKVQALNGISFALWGGQLTLLMGPSGSGKTTLLSVLGCLLTPTEGEVRIRGRTTIGAPSAERAKLRRDHIGFVFQAYRLLPALTATDNVRVALDIRNENTGAAMNRARDALSMVGMRHREAAFPQELSGGEQQRVAIARALVSGPSAILADEPTGALDTENGMAVMKILARVAHDPSQAVLVITHDLRLLQFADRIVHIEDGRILGEEQQHVRPVASQIESRAVQAPVQQALARE